MFSSRNLNDCIAKNEMIIIESKFQMLNVHENFTNIGRLPWNSRYPPPIAVYHKKATKSQTSDLRKMLLVSAQASRFIFSPANIQFALRHDLNQLLWKFFRYHSKNLAGKTNKVSYWADAEIGKIQFKNSKFHMHKRRSDYLCNLPLVSTILDEICKF